MRSVCTGFSLLAVGVVVAGCLSSPRDFASPACTIRIVDEHGSSLSRVSVARHWDDRDSNKRDSDFAETDDSGVARFPAVPARVGLLTGAATKTVGNLSSCAWGSGTRTSISVHYAGRYILLSGERRYHQVAPTVFSDSESVTVRLFTDDKTNTLVFLEFPKGKRNINYTLVSRRQNEQGGGVSMTMGCPKSMRHIGRGIALRLESTALVG